MVTGLKPGENYIFRVKAVNEKGVSNPIESESVACGKKAGERHFLTCQQFCSNIIRYLNTRAQCGME